MQTISYLVKTMESKYHRNSWRPNHFFLMPSRFEEFLEKVTIRYSPYKTTENPDGFPVLTFKSGLRHKNCRVTEIVRESADKTSEKKEILYQVRKNISYCDDDLKGLMKQIGERQEEELQHEKEENVPPQAAAQKA